MGEFPVVFINVVLGLLFIALGVPLARRMVPPNAWYGFRVPQTLNDPEVWYPVNSYSGRLLAWGGAVLIGAAVIVGRLPGVTPDAAMLGLTMGMVAGLVFITILTYRYMGVVLADQRTRGARGEKPAEPAAPAGAAFNPKVMALLFVLLGILFIGTSIPMVQRAVPPNPTYGFRTPETLGSARVWYDANAYSGWTMIGAGAVIIVAAVALALSRAVPPQAYIPAMIAIFLLSLGASLALSFQHLHALG